MNEESLFAAALSKATGAERQAFLDAACGSDIVLRQRVEQLLAAKWEARNGKKLERFARVGLRTRGLVAVPPNN
jgi:hypothetical protein